MKPETEVEFLKELKKMNGFLEAIDWKLWNLHKKYAEGGAVAVSQDTVEVPAPVATAPSTSDIAVPSIPKYPSIEKWSA